MNRCIGYFAYFVAWPLASVQVCKLKQCVLFFCTHVNNENPTFLPTLFTVSRFVTGWMVVESGKHIWLYNSDLCQFVKSVWFVCQWFWNRFNWPTSGCAWSWIGVVSSWIVGLVWGTNFDPVSSPVQPQYNSKQNLLSLRAARRWPVVYAGPYDKTSPLAVSILFNENVLILFNFIIWIYINIWMQF